MWFCCSNFLIFLVFSIHAVHAEVEQSPGMTLVQAYEAALKQSESIEMQNELLIQSREVQLQGVGALMPSLVGSYTRLHQQSPTSVTGASISPAEQSTTLITLQQPLFRGFREFAALRQSKHLMHSQQQALLGAARQLFYDLATAYNQVLALQGDVFHYREQLKLNQKQLEEQKKFYQIGRSKVTDVYAFSAQVTSLQVQLETTLGLLEAAKNALVYYTGWDRDVLLEDQEQNWSLNETISSYLKKIDDREDIQLAQKNMLANEAGIDINFGQHYPSMDFYADYYFNRPGVLKTVHWDVRFVLTLPIFQGGVIQSQVRQAHSMYRQSQLVLSQTRKLAEKEIRSFYDAVCSDVSTLERLKELVKVTDQNQKASLDYFHHGLVTVVDFLIASSNHQDAQRQLANKMHISKLDSVKFQAAIGERKEIKILP